MGPFAGVSSLAQSLGGHKMSSFLHSAWLNPLQRDYKSIFHGGCCLRSGGRLAVTLLDWRWGAGLQRLSAIMDTECGLGWAAGGSVFPR